MVVDDLVAGAEDPSIRVEPAAVFVERTAVIPGCGTKGRLECVSVFQDRFTLSENQLLQTAED